ncbi:MAG: TIGR04283 family arsenosugar biosynthesis glycosyltransferase [Sphingomicrobium sp.]
MLTIVIPTLNARASLGACLASFDGADEILVVDGDSTDGTVALAQREAARVISAPRGRGAQLLAGGAAANGDWLLFFHADTRLGAGWRAAVAAHIANTPEQVGYFELRLDDNAWQARVIERAVALRARLLGLPYGDQGLLISRCLYDQIGGFRPLALMEDVDLVRRIGRHRLRRLDEFALTSADRWRRDGWLRRSARNLACLSLYAVGVAPTRIARLYR